jgi:DNA polymerase I-like protein with 3'-5' exonuclease and polymerase domains
LNTNDAYLYGAGDVLIGGLLQPYAEEEEKRRIGKNIKRRFLNKTPALKNLIEAVKKRASDRHYLIGLDGRRLHVRSEHSALNLLLQSAGALLMKKATVIFWEDVQNNLGYTFGKEIAQMAHIHDEFQLAVREDIDKELIGNMAVNSIRKAGEHFKFRCPLDGEYKTGSNWAETH